MSRAVTLLRSKPFRIAAIVAALVGLYAVLGFKVAPSLLRTQAVDYVRTTYGRELAIGAIELNPFSLRLEARDIALPDSDRRTMLGARRVVIDFELSSLWHRAYTFKEVTLEGPMVLVVRRPDGRFNLADLAPKPTTPVETDTKGPPSLRLEFFNLRDGALEYDDFARAQPLVRKLAPLALALKDFETTAQGGAFSLAAQSPQGERFHWRGTLSMTQNFAWNSELSVVGLRATGIAELLGDALPFALTHGTIDVDGKVRGELGDTLALQLDLDDVALNDVAVRARDAQDDWITIPKTHLTRVQVAIPEQRASIARIKVEGVKAQTWLETDGSANLTRLFATANASAAPTAQGAPDRSSNAAMGRSPSAASAGAPERPPDRSPSAAEAGAPERPPEQSASTWQVDIERIEANVATLEFEDRARARGTKITLAPLDLTAENTTLDLSKPVPIQLAATVEEQGTISITGSVTPQPLAATLDVAVDKLPIALLLPYALPKAALTVERGVAATNGKLQIKETAEAQLHMQFTGRAALASFESIDNELRQDFINFGRIDVESLDLSLFPHAVNIARISVKNPYARVIVSPEQILNVSAVLDPEGTAELRRERAAQAEASQARPGAKRREERQSKPEKEPVAKNTPAAEPPDAIPIRIREVRIDGGRMNFSDLNIQPNFNAEIRALRGAFSRLSTAKSSRADVKLTGNVGEFSPVSITGAVQPFAFETFTDMTLRFENISLPIFNPYSGRFAGYNISKGALTTELQYNIQAKQLDARHHIRIDQLEWGEATPERGEATLPVKFATALLRDRNGVINLDVPVKGTLDDPKFRVGPIVWQVIKNILTKAATAPFALLGSLFKGSEDAQFIDFAPGDTTLEQATQDRIRTLSTALGEKPGLALDVPIGGQPDLDTAALIDARYRTELGNAMRSRLKVGNDAPVPAFETLDSGQQQDVLKAVLRKLMGAVPAIPDPPPAQEGESRDGAKARREAAAIRFLETSARAAIKVEPADLDRLAQQRAESVQRALLEGGQLEPARVFLVKNDKVSAHEGKVRFELGLK